MVPAPSAFIIFASLTSDLNEKMEKTMGGHFFRTSLYFYRASLFLARVKPYLTNYTNYPPGGDKWFPLLTYVLLKGRSSDTVILLTSSLVDISLTKIPSSLLSCPCAY